MYNIFTRSKSYIITAVAATTLLAAGSAFAAKDKSGKPFTPGKPGTLNILETALDVNGKGIETIDEDVGEFAYLYGAVLCLAGSQLIASFL